MVLRVFLFITLFFTLASRGAEVRKIEWNTKHAATPAEIKNTKLLPLIRLGVNNIPESTLMQLSSMGSQSLGLSKEDSNKLSELLNSEYEKIDTDPLFKKAPSVLDYCYSSNKPDKGIATVYLPDKVTTSTPSIVFLHGYGGSFKFYLRFLAKIFPDHIIICPAYGNSCAFIPQEYLNECMQAVNGSIKVQLSTPMLIGISAGGFGGFREYCRNPSSYRGYICLASYPPKEVIPKLPRNGSIHILAGEKEAFAKDLLRQSHSFKAKSADFSLKFIPKEQHFFLLSSQAETAKILAAWNKDNLLKANR